MNQQMWKHVQTQENLALLIDLGVASLDQTQEYRLGDIGSGR